MNAVKEFDPNRVRPLPGQPRKRFRGIKELADSIFEVGQQSPGIVTIVTDDPAFDAQLVDGERRLRACRMVKVPFRAEVRQAAGAEEIFAASFAANFGKQDHDAIEIAEGLARLQKSGKTIEQLGRIAGKSVGWVTQHLSLLKLHPDVQGMMVADAENESAKLTFSIALLLVPVDPDQQRSIARKITAGEGMGLAAARRYVLKARHQAGDADAYAGGEQKRRTVSAMESIIADFSDRIGVYLDMPGKDFNALIDSADPRKRRMLIESIEDMRDTLQTMAQAIAARLPSVRQNTAQPSNR